MPAFPTITVTPGVGATVNTLPNAGQTTMSGGLPVVLPSDQSPIPVTATQLTTINTTLGTPAQDGTDATGVTQLTGGAGVRGWLSGIYSKVAGSIVVTGTFWQATQPVSATSLPLPTGAATAAGLTTINTTLGTPMQASGGSVAVVSGASTYQETTITAGGTAQNLFAGATPANGFEIINNSTTEILYFRENGTATVAGATSAAIAAGAAYTTPRGYKPTAAISVIATTTAHPIIARSY